MAQKKGNKIAAAWLNAGKKKEKQKKRTRRQRKGKGKSLPKATLYRAFNALDNYHLPLPRSSGPYSVWRSSVQFQTSLPVLILGVYKNVSDTAVLANTPVWSNICCLAGTGLATAINAAASTNAVGFDFSRFASDNLAVLSPAAATFQIRCPTSVFTAAGTVYGTRVKSDLALAGSARTWSQFATQIFSTQSMRAMTAYELCGKCVKVDLLPMDIVEMEDFRNVNNSAGGVFAWDATGSPNFLNTIAPCALTPAVVYNPTLATLDIVATFEWRVRFDPLDMAAAGHVNYPPAAESTWNKLVHQAHSIGESGFEDMSTAVKTANKIARTAAEVGGVLLPLAAVG